MIEITKEQALEYLTSKGSDRLRQQVASGVVNPIELAHVLDIKPQMVYNYIRSGRIKARLNDTQHKVIELEVAVEFVSNYLSKKASKEAKIEAELAGE